MSDRCELFDVVRDHDTRDTERLVEFANQTNDHTHRDGIEADKRFVVDQQLRIHHDGASQGHAPRHATGELRRHELGSAAQANRFELGQHKSSQHRLGQSRMRAHRKGDVLENGKISQ